MSMDENQLSKSSSKWFVPMWVLVASVSLIAGALSPSEFLGWWNALIVVHMGTSGSESVGSPVPVHLCRSIPAVLGVSSLVAIWIRNRKVRGAVLTLTSSIALVLCYGDVYLTDPEQRAVGNWIEMMVAAAMIAAGNRTMLQVSTRRLPRILAGLGGAKLFLSFLIPGDDYIKSSILSLVVMEGVTGREWEAALFATLLLTYAILGILSPFVRKTPRLRCLVVSILGYVLLIAFPLVLYQQWAGTTNGGPEPYRSLRFAFMLKFWLLGTGYTILLAVGLATWVEEALSKKETVSGIEEQGSPSPATP